MILIFDFTAVINVLAYKKFNYRQTGLYRITKSDSLKGTYRIYELDGAVFRDTYADNRLKRFHAAVILDVFSRHGTPAPSDNRDSDIVNFANTFQGEDLDVKNLAFEGKNRNDEVEGEDKTIKNKKQAELRAAISDNLSFTVVIPRRQENKRVDNNTRRYNLKKSIKEIRQPNYSFLFPL